jgi:hypothetical protein
MLRPALFAVTIFVTLLPSLGSAHPAAPSTDFAAVVPRLAYSLLPWTPFVPFVFVRPRRVTLVRIALVLAVVAALVLEPRVPVVARVAIAAALGATLDDLARDARPLSLLALCAAALAFLLVRDLSFEPGRVVHARAIRIATIAVTTIFSAALVLRPRFLR